MSAPALSVVPADEAGWEELRLVFGSRGPASRCWCQRYKLPPRESFGSVPDEVRADRLREQTGAGHPGASRTSGLLARLGDEPVGWCAVEPRTAYDGLVRVFRVPWEGRDEDRADDSVWAVTCVLARAGFRRQGVGRHLVRAAVDHARDRGARALEGYPVLTSEVISEELHVGTLETFLDAGFHEVSRPTPRRAVVRIDFPDPRDRPPGSGPLGR